MKTLLKIAQLIGICLFVAMAPIAPVFLVGTFDILSSCIFGTYILKNSELYSIAGNFVWLLFLSIPLSLMILIIAPIWHVIAETQKHISEKSA